MSAGHRAAPPTERLRAQIRNDVVTILRNGEQFMVTLLFPLMALIGLVVAPFPDLPGPSRVAGAMPGVLALALLSSAFTGQAIATAFDRRYGVLRLLGTTPLGRDGFLVSRAAAVVVVQVVQFAVGIGLGLALGWRPPLAGIPGMLAAWLVGTTAFVALALLFAGTLRAEAVLALANLLWVIMAGAGGVLVPEQGYPHPWETVVGLLPPGALADAFRVACLDGAFPALQIAVLAGWAAFFGAAAVRFFRWSD